MKRLYHARTRGGECRHCLLDSPNEDDNPTELTGAVGEKGANFPDDVVAVQTRLNRVGADSGGPVKPLDEDGECGPLTIAAIWRFQQRYPGELLADGRIDPGKNSWKKLVALSERPMPVGTSPRPAKAAPGKAPTAAGKASNAVAPATQQMLNAVLYLTRWRIYEAIKALDVASRELDGCRMLTFMDPKARMTLFEAYERRQIELDELPTVDRCFHIAHKKMAYANVKDVLRRLRKIYVTMIDVIVANTITTPQAEATGRRRYLRVVPQTKLNSAHTRSAIADAPDGGWWDRNANVSHIRVGSAHLNDDDLLTTMIHEMGHFVSHPSTYMVGAHVSGSYNKAFDDTHHQAVRNAFCYEWYAYLAAFKHERSKSNSDLDLK